MGSKTLHNFETNYLYKHMDIKRLVNVIDNNKGKPAEFLVQGDVQIDPNGIRHDFYLSKVKTWRPRWQDYGHFFKQRNMVGDKAIGKERPLGLMLSNKNARTKPVGVCYTAASDLTEQVLPVYIEIEPYCNAVLEEHFYNDADIKIHRIVYVLREGATLRIIRDINLGGTHETVQIIESDIIQHPASKLYIETKSEIQDYLQDLYFVEASQNTVTDIKGRYSAKEDNSIHVITDIDHNGPDCSSNVDVRSVTDDKSRFTFSGNLTVRKEAEGADAHLKNKNLQLVDTATVITEPKLDICTKEIACTHGCTVSSIDEDQLYLLNTRGIDSNNAKQILTEAFLNG
jgi:hypothetical protein